MQREEDVIENLRECSFLGIARSPIDARSKLQLVWMRLVLYGADCMAWYSKRQEESSLQARAARVREIARVFNRSFGFGYFPEILQDYQTCPLCEELTLLVVHSDMLCDSCWLKGMAILQQFCRNVKSGMKHEEARRLAEER